MRIYLSGLAAIMLLFTPLLGAAPQNKEFSQDIALVTGVSEALAITEYDIYLRADIKNNRLSLLSQSSVIFCSQDFHPG